MKIRVEVRRSAYKDKIGVQLDNTEYKELTSECLLKPEGSYGRKGISPQAPGLEISPDKRSVHVIQAKKTGIMKLMPRCLGGFLDQCNDK